jgi:hypothetical protein
MAKVTPEYPKPETDISAAEVRKLIRRVNRDLDKLERAAQELEEAAQPHPH